MKVAGVIAEYNPFHNGHKYQLDEIRKRTDSDYIIVAMSGNFVQRGIPALIDKYERAKYALMNGADLVLELPSIYATASASYFALGGVSLLASTGVLDYLCFGAECDDVNLLSHIAELLSTNKDSLDSSIINYQKKGISYPAARAKAISEIIADHKYNIEEIISSPNNILAIEYLRHLPKDIKPILIQRQGDAYNAKAPSSAMASASAIRELLEKGHEIQEYIPENLAQPISQYSDSYGFVYPDSISSMLGMRLYDTDDYSEIMDCSNDLSEKIKKNLKNYKSFSDFCQLLKSKDITYTRISRVLLGLLLGNTKDLYAYATLNGLSVPYIKILGFKKDSKELLSAIKASGTAPLLSKMADAHTILTDEALTLLEKDTYSSNIYRILQAQNQKKLIPNDYGHSICII